MDGETPSVELGVGSEDLLVKAIPEISREEAVLPGWTAPSTQRECYSNSESDATNSSDYYFYQDIVDRLVEKLECDVEHLLRVVEELI